MSIWRGKLSSITTQRTFKSLKKDSNLTTLKSINNNNIKRWNFLTIIVIIRNSNERRGFLTNLYGSNSLMAFFIKIGLIMTQIK